MRGAVRQVCVWWDGLRCMVTNTSFSLAGAGFVRVVLSWFFVAEQRHCLWRRGWPDLPSFDLGC